MQVPRVSACLVAHEGNKWSPLALKRQTVNSTFAYFVHRFESDRVSGRLISSAASIHDNIWLRVPTLITNRCWLFSFIVNYKFSYKSEIEYLTEKEKLFIITFYCLNLTRLSSFQLIYKNIVRYICPRVGGFAKSILSLNLYKQKIVNCLEKRRASWFTWRGAATDSHVEMLRGNNGHRKGTVLKIC